MNKLFICLVFLFSGLGAIGQTQLTVPEASQSASISQRIGITDIRIDYHSPLAKGREVWGKLVPYNEVWRAGANENTTITFTHDVKIEGTPVPAGRYGLHMIPTEKEWTVILSKNADAWGSFFYKQSEDVARVKVIPTAGNMQDWLSYTFMDPKDQSVIVALRWEKISVPFKINVDVPEIVFQNMNKELTGLNGFFWQGYNQAAAYSFRNNVHMDKAYEWADRSINIQPNFTNLTTKAKMLEKQGKKDEATALHAKAVPLADEIQLNAYGYELMGAGNTKEAIEIFRLNVKKYPGSWNVYDSLAEALQNMGDKKGALENYKLALTKAPDNQKKRLQTTINSLM